jgi:uncharacterized damage-inducible protein DinB
LLASTPAVVETEITSMGEDLAAWHPVPEEWCAKQVVGHMIEAERRSFVGRIVSVMNSPADLLEAWEPDPIAAARRDCEQSSQELLAEFSAARSDSVRLIRALPPDRLERAARHPKVGYLTISAILHHWIRHDHNHLGQIHGNILQWVWPHCGNARRFSQPGIVEE